MDIITEEKRIQSSLQRDKALAFARALSLCSFPLKGSPKAIQSMLT
jgi:hypothetical protein